MTINYGELNPTTVLFAIHAAEEAGASKFLYTFIMEAMGITVPEFHVMKAIQDHIKILKVNNLININIGMFGTEYTVNDAGRLLVINMQNTQRALNS